jgi:hypothetical protein
VALSAKRSGSLSKIKDAQERLCTDCKKCLAPASTTFRGVSDPERGRLDKCRIERSS